MNQSINHSQRLDQCLITGLPVVKVLDFGQHAYADTFVAEDQLIVQDAILPDRTRINKDSVIEISS